MTYVAGTPKDSSMEDFRDAKPKLSADVQIKFLKRDERGDFYIIGKKGKGDYLRIHGVGKEIVEMLDGKTSVADIAENLGKRDIEVDVPRFIALLAKKGIFENIPSSGKQKRENTLMIHYIPLFKRTERFLKVIHTVFRKFFRKKVLLLLAYVNFIILAIYLMTMLTGYLSSREIFFVRNSLASAITIYAFAIMPFLIAIHELSHALVCYHYGGKPQDMGIALFFIIPFFYADTTDTWMMEKKQSIMVFLAGPLSTFFIGNFCVLLSFALPTAYASLLRMIAFGSYLTVLVGFNPLMESDGYFILQTLSDFPNLISHARRFVPTWLKSKLGHLSVEDKEQMESYSKQERRILVFYAPAALLINVVFAVIMGYWGIIFVNDYSRLILSVRETFPNILPYTMIELGMQSMYLAFIILFLVSVAKKIRSSKHQDKL